MQDIADALGTTRVSVSKALNNQVGVGDALRKRILNAAEQMGYRSKKEGADAANQCFAFIVAKRFFLETDKFYNVIFYYMNKLCQSAGHQLIPIVLNLRDEDELVMPELLGARDPSGIFLVGEIKDQYIQMVSGLGVPMVAIDFYRLFLRIDSILTDNYYLGYAATCHLIELGHRQIGFVGNRFETTSITDRYLGYLKAMMQHNLPILDEWLISNNDPDTGVYHLGVQLPAQLPTAFVCHCDMAAHFLVSALALRGAQVPRDVSLISFDNTELSRTMTPALSSYDIDKREIAEYALQAMTERIISGDGPPRRHYIHTQLIERESVSPII